MSFSLNGLGQQPAVQPRITRAVDEAELTILPRNTHPLALPRYDHGAAPPSTTMDRMLLVLKRSLEQEAALTSLLDEQQDKSSPNYHKWLTPDEFGKRFGPADADIQTVTAWLASHGFQIAKVSKGRSVIEFSGTAAMVEEAFHTAIHKYIVSGAEHWANASDPQIPGALTPVVAGVHTLHNFLKKPQVKIIDRIAAKLDSGPPPQVTFAGGLHALGPGDYATIYHFPTLQLPGAGSGIAVVARSNINLQDVQEFRNLFSLQGNGPQVFVDGPDPGDLGGGEEIEAVLDATWSSVTAPMASVDVIVSASTNTTDGVDLSELYIIDNNIGDIMTESFGTCEAAVTSAEATNISQLAEQAAAQGITYLVATGDTGSAGCDNLSETVATGPVSVNVLASSPFTIAVGGTMFNEHGSDATYWNSTNQQATQVSARSYIPEDVWNQSCTAAQCGQKSANIAAGGGGVSVYFAKPTWQAGVTGIPSDGMRDLPDVSLTAAGHDPYLLCVAGSCIPDGQGNFFFIGVAGTSASTPSFAGIMALVNSQVVPLNAHPRLGQINYVLYPLAASQKTSSCSASSISLPASTCIFHDITAGNNSVPGNSDYGSPTAKYQSGAGYDVATGLGSVDVTNLINNWNSVNFNATTTTLSVNPTTVVHGRPVTVNVSVTSSSGVPTGDVSLYRSGISPGTPSSPIQGNFFTLTAGSVSATTNLLPGGYYSVAAHYSGDAKFAASESNNIGLTITPEPTTAVLKAFTLDSNANLASFTSVPYGSFVYLRSDVIPSSGFGIPTGSVNFADTGGAIPGNPYQLNGQGNTTTPNGLYGLAPGQHSVTSSYGGDPSFAASSSAAVPFTITPASTTSTLTATGATQGITFNASVSTSSGGNPPSGSFVFNVNGTNTTLGALGTPAVINPRTDAVITGAQASASFTASNLTVGQNYTATVSYNGDSNYLGSSANVSGTVQPDFAMGLSSNIVTIPFPGASGAVMLTITAQNGFTGTVTPTCSGLPSESTCTFNPTTVAGNGSTTATIHTKAPVAKLALPHHFQLWAAFSAMGLLGMFLTATDPRSRHRAKFVLAMIVLSVAASLNCGGGSSSQSTPPPPPPDPGTPVGQYMITVTGASGATTHTTTFTLQVQ